MSQSPAARNRRGAGLGGVAISLGLTVPRLVDLDCAAARARGRIRTPGRRCVSRPADTPGAVTGRVFEQTPAAGGAAVAAPAEIRVVVWAARPVAVPDVREAALDAAIALIEKAQLVARPDNRQGVRTVTEQTPPWVRSSMREASSGSARKRGRRVSSSAKLWPRRRPAWNSRA